MPNNAQQPIQDPVNVILEDFVLKMLEEKGLKNLEPEVLSQAKQDLMSRLEDRINAAIVEKLPPEQLTTFDEMLKKEGISGEEIQTFCRQHIPDLDLVIAQTLADFRRLYVS